MFYIIIAFETLFRSKNYVENNLGYIFFINTYLPSPYVFLTFNITFDFHSILHILLNSFFSRIFVK